jgi:hypothetical protein
MYLRNIAFKLRFYPRNIGFELGLHPPNIGFEFGLHPCNINFKLGLNARHIRLRGKILMRGFAQGFGERLSLLRREAAFLAQPAGEAERVIQYGGDRLTMEHSPSKVHQGQELARPR